MRFALTGKKPLILVGDSAFAEVAFEYFTVESEYEVVAFAVEQAYRRRDSLLGCPVVDFEDVETRYDPSTHSFYAALVYTERNALRRRLFDRAKSKGYAPASFVSRGASVWRNVAMGEHCFTFENNVIQPFARIGSNVVLWSGNHIGHHSEIGDDCFVASHVVVSGFVKVGRACFLGVNATVANNVAIGDGCVIGAGALVLGDVPDGTTVVGMWRGRRPSAS